MTTRKPLSRQAVTASRDTVTSAQETISPGLAKKWLDENNPNNRKQRTRKSKQYAAMMTRGQWIAEGDVYQFDEDGNLLDGQHRLMALVEANHTIRATVIRGLPSRRFKIIDSGMLRSPGDSLGNDVAQSSHKASTSRLLFIYELDGDPRRSEDLAIVTRLDLGEYYDTHTEEIDYALSVGGRLYKSFAGGNLTAWTAFVVLTMRASSNHAEDFLEGVLTGANLDKGDARLALRNWLANDRKLPNAGSHLGILIKAWNHWMDGALRQALMFRDNEDFPKVSARRSAKGIAPNTAATA